MNKKKIHHNLLTSTSHKNNISFLWFGFFSAILGSLFSISGGTTLRLYIITAFIILCLLLLLNRVTAFLILRNEEYLTVSMLNKFYAENFQPYYIYFYFSLGTLVLVKNFIPKIEIILICVGIAFLVFILFYVVASVKNGKIITELTFEIHQIYFYLVLVMKNTMIDGDDEFFFDSFHCLS